MEKVQSTPAQGDAVIRERRTIASAPDPRLVVVRHLARQRSQEELVMIDFTYVTHEMSDEVPYGRCYPGVIATTFTDRGVEVATVRLRTGRTINVPAGILIDVQEWRLLDIVTCDDEWATSDNVGQHRFLKIGTETEVMYA